MDAYRTTHGVAAPAHTRRRCTRCQAHRWATNALQLLTAAALLGRASALGSSSSRLARLQNAPNGPPHTEGWRTMAAQFGLYNGFPSFEKRCRKPPTFLYIGVGHSGSTTLAEELNAHPHVKFGDVKEHAFLSYLEPVDASYTFKKYASQFDVPCKTKATFDALPGVFGGGNPGLAEFVPPQQDFPQGTWRGHALGVPYVRALRDLLGPDLKLIMMIRDPLSFVNSVFTDEHYRHPEISMERVIDGDYGASNMSLFVKKSCYADALDSWLEVFPRDHFLFLRSEDFFAKPQEVLDKVFGFIGVEPREYEPSELKAYGRRRASTGAAQHISASTRAMYHDNPKNRECKSRLEAQTGLTFDWSGFVEKDAAAAALPPTPNTPR